MIHKRWRMFSQNFRSIAHTPGLFKTLSIIRIYSKPWANIWIYSNVYFVMKTNTNIYLSTKISEYSNIRIFVLIPVLSTMNHHLLHQSTLNGDRIMSVIACLPLTIPLTRNHSVYGTNIMLVIAGLPPNVLWGLASIPINLSLTALN